MSCPVWKQRIKGAGGRKETVCVCGLRNHKNGLGSTAHQVAEEVSCDMWRLFWDFNPLGCEKVTREVTCMRPEYPNAMDEMLRRTIKQQTNMQKMQQVER